MTELTVSNTNALVTRTIEQAPSDKVVREIVENAIQASINATDPQINVMTFDPATIDFDGFSSDKLCVWNNGPGMSSTQIRDATNLSSTINKMIGINGNFGIGFKVAALPINKVGLLFMSCHAGIVSLVRLYKNEFTNTYCREDFYDTDAESPTGFQDVDDISEYVLPWGTVEDWTAIVLCGNDEQQNTIINPYGHEKDLALPWFYNDIYRRYFSIPPTIDFRLEVGHRSKGCTTFKTLYESIQAAKANVLGKAMDEIIDDVSGSGIKIWYVYDGYRIIGDKERNQKPSSFFQNAGTSAPFNGLVHKHEIYDVMEKATWKSVAGSLGILYGSNSLKAFVILPDEYDVSPDQYRSVLQRNDIAKTPVKLMDFATEIRNNTPDWFKDKIKEFAPETITSDDLLDKAQAFLNNLMIREASGPGSNAGKYSERRTKGAEIGTNPNTRKTPIKRNVNKVKNGGDGDSYMTTMKLPKIEYLFTEDAIENASACGLVNRAAEYIQDGAIYINCTYDVLDHTTSELMLSYSHYETADLSLYQKIKDEAGVICRDEMAWIILKAIGYTLAKKSRKGYCQEDINIGLHPVSLTTHADTLMDGLDECAKKLKAKVVELVEGSA